MSHDLSKVETLKVLKEARRLLLEYGWTDGRFARNKYGHEVSWLSPNAVKFCSLGALNRAEVSVRKDKAVLFPNGSAQHLIEWTIGTDDLIRINDKFRFQHPTDGNRMKHKYEIIAYFDVTIHLLEDKLEQEGIGYTEDITRERSLV